MIKVKRVLLCGMLCVSLMGLTACGDDKKANDNPNTGTNNETSIDHNGSDSAIDKNDGNGGVVNDVTDTVEDAGDAIIDGAEDIGNDVENAVDDMTGNENDANEKANDSTTNNTTEKNSTTTK